jgi:hypothetical protein
MENIKGNETEVLRKNLLLSPVTNNDFSISDKFADTSFEIEYKNFIMGAKEYVKADQKVFCFKTGEAGDGGREEHFLKEGEVQNIHNSCMLNKITKERYKYNTTELNILSTHL